jgi:phenylacetate-CoA ligase
MKIYFKLPASFQNILVSLQGYYIQSTRFNKKFLRELEKYENSNPDNVNIHILKEFLINAQNSKFWKDRFTKYNVDVFSEDLIKEIEKLPILTKNEVQENLQNIRVDIKNGRVKIVNTSGTTGTGLIFQSTQLMENKQWAVWWRYRRRHGIQIDMWMGWFGGRTIMDVNDNKPPFWRVNFFGKQIMFSAHHLSAESVEYYHKAILDRKLRWLHGYPSQLAFLATLIKEKKLPYIKVDFVTLGAENLLSHQIDIIKEVFGVEPIQHYGLAEGVTNISQLVSGEFQLDQDFAFTEFIPSNLEHNIYKIIGTNYSNFAFPLIRYDTNDLVTLEKNQLGLNKIISIDGRNEDFITLPSGVKLGRLDHLFKNATFVKEAQIYQPVIDKIILRIVPSNNYDKISHEEILKKECSERFGNSVKISFEYFDTITRTKSGKLKFVISDL